jgi:hypothetical protein
LKYNASVYLKGVIKITKIAKPGQLISGPVLNPGSPTHAAEMLPTCVWLMSGVYILQYYMSNSI